MGLFDDVISGHSSTASAWQTIGQSDELESGQRYRVVFTLMGPYAHDTPQKIHDAVFAAKGLTEALIDQFVTLGQSVTVEDVTVNPPTDNDSRLYRWPTFTCAITFTKTGTGTPALIILGIVAAIVLGALGLLFIIMNKSVQKELKGVGATALASTPLVLAGAVLLAVILLARR